MSSRNTAVELLRCVFMFLIVTHHCYYHGIFGPETEGGGIGWWSVLFVGGIAWHVDGFLAISGWFGIRFSWRRFMALWAQMAFYTTLPVFVYEAILTRGLPPLADIVVSGGWFGGVYLLLMLFSPFLNSAVDAMARGVGCTFMHAWIPLAIGMTLSWAPLNLFSGLFVPSAGPYTVFMAIFVYLTARGFHVITPRRIPLRVLLGVILACGLSTVLVCALEAYSTSYGFRAAIDWQRVGVYSGYNAPHVWLMAIALVMVFFWWVEIPARLGRLVTFISPSLFGIFLLHDVMPFGRLLYRGFQQWMFHCVGAHPAVIIVASAIFVFAVSLAVDMGRRGIFHLCVRAYGRIRR